NDSARVRDDSRGSTEPTQTPRPQPAGAVRGSSTASLRRASGAEASALPTSASGARASAPRRCSPRRQQLAGNVLPMSTAVAPCTYVEYFDGQIVVYSTPEFVWASVTKA